MRKASPNAYLRLALLGLVVLAIGGCKARPTSTLTPIPTNTPLPASTPTLVPTNTPLPASTSPVMTMTCRDSQGGVQGVLSVLYGLFLRNPHHCGAGVNRDFAPAFHVPKSPDSWRLFWLCCLLLIGPLSAGDSETRKPRKGRKPRSTGHPFRALWFLSNHS
jgi:hypothetical protein